MKSLTVDDRRLKARVVAVQKTGETATIDGETWEKSIFTLEVTRFSKRTPEEVVPPHMEEDKGFLIGSAVDPTTLNSQDNPTI